MGGTGAYLALALVVATTEGARDRQQIDWEPPEGCPSQPALMEATHAYLGRALAAYPNAVYAHALVEAAPEGFRVQLRVDVDGSVVDHQFSAPDCDQLGREVALVIAGAVDPFARGPAPPTERLLLVTPIVVQRPRTRPARPQVAVETPEPDSSPEDSSPEPAASDWILTADDRPESASRPRGPIVGSLGVAGTGFAGLFPQVGGGVSVEGGLERGLFRWQASATGWFGGQFRSATADLGANLWAATGSTSVCIAPTVRRVHFAACARVGAGAITASAVNTQVPNTSVRPWAFAGPDMRAVWVPRPQLGIYLGVNVLPALARPGWTVSNPDASFRIPAVAGLLRLGVELRELGPR